MHIESFKVFCDLVETGSFTKAAIINGITQSAVSQQLSAMERTFKSRLIERSKIRLQLTLEGKAVYEYSQQLVAQYKTLETKMLEMKDIISGTILVATIYSIGLYDLPPYIKRFMTSYPTVHVRVEYLGASQVYEDVFSNVVDLGLVAYPVKDSKLEVVPLRREPLVLICSPEHPFASKATIRLKQLAGQNFISFDPDTPTRTALDKILREHDVQVEHVMEFDNVETVKRAVEIDAGISIVPQITVNQEIDKQTLATVKFEDGEFFRPIAAIYKKNRVLTPAMKQFLAVLKG